VGKETFRACRPALHPRGRGQRGMRPAGRMRRRRKRGVWRSLEISGETDGLRLMSIGRVSYCAVRAAVSFWRGSSARFM
jgi:hypothetical protein